MSTDRFEPRASGAMASMFDDVSGRYDFLNRVMTLGQDRAWREALWREVPPDAQVVLDLCTGSGSSLTGLRRPGRRVLGVDVSLAMLQVAEAANAGPGWAPRLACADAFRLPLRDASLDAVTVAFGMRNLRPRDAALRELARVLRPGGTLVVLEAAAPAPGPGRWLHTLWLRHAVPAFGLLSRDPSAYRYLRDSIFEFGAGPEFERELLAGGFGRIGRRGFLLGASRLWVAGRGAKIGQNADAKSPAGHSAIPAGPPPQPGKGHPAGQDDGGRALGAARAAFTTALTLALLWGLATWANVNLRLPLNAGQRTGGWILLVGGSAGFAIRTAGEWLKWTTKGRVRRDS